MSSILPPEILDLVIDQLRDDVEALKTCTLTSLVLLDRSSKHLLKSLKLTLYRSRSHVNLFIDALHSGLVPRVPRYAKEVRIEGDYLIGNTRNIHHGVLAVLFNNLPRLHSLHLGSLIWGPDGFSDVPSTSDIVIHLQRPLKNLSLNEVSLPANTPIHYSIPFIQLILRAENVSISSIFDFDDEPLLKAAGSQIRLPPVVQQLTCEGYSHLWLGPLSRIHPWTNLKHLKLQISTLRTLKSLRSFLMESGSELQECHIQLEDELVARMVCRMDYVWEEYIVDLSHCSEMTSFHITTFWSSKIPNHHHHPFKYILDVLSTLPSTMMEKISFMIRISPTDRASAEPFEESMNWDRLESILDKFTDMQSFLWSFQQRCTKASLLGLFDTPVLRNVIKQKLSSLRHARLLLS